jgi:post-segregation antitoxin (ccd killing protein)
MKQLTVIKTIRFTGTQAESLKTLESYDVNVSQFIRQAIKEKIARDWKGIKERKNKIKCPF